MSVRVLRQKLCDQLGLVCREVVGDDVNLPARGLVGDDVGEESDELSRGVARGRLAKHLAGARVEGRIQRQRAMALVLEAVALRPPGRKRQPRVHAIQRLDGGLLIHAEHGRMLRRVEVQADDFGRLSLEVRIIGGHVARQPMRIEAVLGPDPRRRHVRDLLAKLRRQLARRPVGRAISRLALDGPGQRPGLDSIGHLAALPPRVAGKQCGETILGKTLALARDMAVAAIELGADLRLGATLRQQQNQPRMTRRIGPSVSTACLAPKFHVFPLGKLHHHALHGHDHTTRVSGTCPYVARLRWLSSLTCTRAR